MKNKSLAVLLGILFTAIILAGCVEQSEEGGDGSGESTGDLKIGMSFQEMNNPYFTAMNDAFESAANEIGAETIIADAQHDVSKQINDIDDMIQQGIDILLINPADSEGAEAAVQAAHDAGVIVVAIDAQAEGPLDSFVGSENYNAG